MTLITAMRMVIPRTPPATPALRQGPFPFDDSRRRLSGLAAALCCLLLSCSDSGTGPVPVATIDIAGAVRVIEVGASLQLSTATLDAEGRAVSATVAWTSSNQAAATVSPNGLVAGLAVGTTTITASAGSATASVDLTVRDNAPLTAELSGTIRRIDIVLEADRTYTATSDLVLWADRELRVLGTLKADPGVAISLVSDSAITIDGTIDNVTSAPSNPTALSSTAAGRDMLINGPVVRIGLRFQMMVTEVKSAGHIVVAGGGPGFVGNRSFTIDGRSALMRAGDGAQAMSAQEDGQPGFSILIGDAVALAAAAQVTGMAAFAFDDITVRPDPDDLFSTIEAGRGGLGWSITTIAEAVDQGTIVIANATNGGKGGGVFMAARNSITIDAGSVAAGFGGEGGTLGSLFISPTPLEIPDGNFDLFKAKSLTARTGNGGDGGDVAISAPQVNGTALVGIGGLSGEAVVSGGNAAPGGMGGEFEIAMGRDGGFGAGGPSQTANAFTPVVYVRNALNGGNANSPLLLGGRGGRLHVTYAPPAPGITEKVTPGSLIEDTGKGGAGYQGCAVNPFTNGTDGGNGGSLSDPSSRIIGATTASFHGGPGGHGNPPGSGGASGKREETGADLGSPGTNGNPCPQLVDAVVLGSPAGPYPAGAIITLDRITGGSISNPEAGCSTRHLHGTIFIDMMGPYGDPFPGNCGHGPIIQVPQPGPVLPIR